MDGGSIAVALVVGGASIWLMVRQLRIMDRQLDIMARQDALLSRRAQLRLVGYVIRPTETDQNLYLSLHVENIGDKTAANFYWHLFIPAEFSRNQRFSSNKGDVDSDHAEDINGREFRRFRSDCNLPAYPTRSVPIGRIACDNAQWAEAIPLHWKLVCEDGAFPPGMQELGDLVVRLDAIALP